MIPYDFDTPVIRQGTDSIKWAVVEGELPMWVADMDFQTAPEIIAAFQERCRHGVFGYSGIPEAWYNAYQDWWQKRHAFYIEREWLLFCTGVVPAISSMVRKLTTVGENIVIQSPVYNIFYNSILNNGRNVLESELHYDGSAYSIDFEDLESKLQNPQTTLLILCNPHNPVGKIWDQATLAQIGMLCKKHHVVVISDEIHCDLTATGKNYVPFASVSEDCLMNSVTCIAPTKTFNLAGLQSAAVVVPNPVLRHKVNRGLNTDEVAEPNSFACLAAITAFEKGAPWLDALRDYLDQNKKMALDFISAYLPGIHTIKADATYLLWLDCRKICTTPNLLYEHIHTTTGLYLAEGSHYGSGGNGFLRMNIACPRQTLHDGLQRLHRALQTFALESIPSRRPPA